MDLMGGLTAVSKGLEIVKALRDLESKVNDSSFKFQIAELYTALADAKIALADAKEELAERDKVIAHLKTVQDSKMPVVNYRGYNFGIDESGDSIGRPFCPACEKKDGAQIQITRGLSRHDLCPRCKAVYGTGGYPWMLPDDKKPMNANKDGKDLG